MPDAKTSIVNRVLAALNCEPVADLSDASLASSVAAVKILRVIDDARIDVLARHGWACALEYTRLPPATITNYQPSWPYPWVYLLPAGALRVWEISGERFLWEPRWQVGTTEVDGSDRLIIRVGPKWASQSLDGISWGGPDGYFFGEGWSECPSAEGTIPIVGAAPTPTPTPCAGLLPVCYVRTADWGALDPNLRTAVTWQTAAFAAYSVNGDASRAEKLAAEAEKKIADAIGAEANQEGGQIPLGGSIPLALRNYGR
jgi:hypothetical protein